MINGVWSIKVIAEGLLHQRGASEELQVASLVFFREK
jgi:hypothetical protein